MAKLSVSPFVIEPVEGRLLWSAAPIFGQHPMVLVPNYQPDTVKSFAAPSSIPSPIPISTPSPTPLPVLPPVSTPLSAPVQPPAPADAPEDLKARASRHAKAVCLKWDAVAPAAKTIVIEASTDGQDFTTIGLLDADQTRFRAEHLDNTRIYTFRLFTLDENDQPSAIAEITPKWKC